MTEIAVKGMVCRHCIESVTRVLADLGREDCEVTLGHIRLKGRADDDFLKRLDEGLRVNGFERVTDYNSRIVEEIKRCIIDHVRIERKCPLNLSSCLTDHIALSYDTMSRIFSQSEGRTIEKYFIAQKIELVKELLEYNELTLGRIADMTGYSSPAHLSRQFKSQTGMTPSEYQRMHKSLRKPLNEV